MSRLIRLAAGVAVLCLSFPALSQAPIIYPAGGQSTQQQSKDDGECCVWAKQSTGIDPAVVAQTPATAPPAQPGGERVRGAARGGREARANEASRQKQAQAQQQGKINTFYRGYGACMQGRGYTVN